MATINETPARLDARRQRIVDAIIAPAKTTEDDLAFVPGEVLLATLWPDEESRPTLRWLRKMTKLRALPFLKLGNRVWFDPARVRRHLEKQYTVEPFSL